VTDLSHHAEWISIDDADTHMIMVQGRACLIWWSQLRGTVVDEDEE
jgi:hypothetical protein